MNSHLSFLHVGQIPPFACVHEIAAELKCASYGTERATLQFPGENIDARMLARESNGSQPGFEI